MTRIRLKYVNAFHDRHGRIRHYFRRPGCKCVALPGLPGSAEFMDAYQTALSGEAATRVDIASRRTKPGTIAALTIAYLGSYSFQGGAPETRRTRRNILERFRVEHGHRPVTTLQRWHVEKMVAAKAATPSSARNFLNTLRAMLQFAVDIGMRSDNPAGGVKRVKIKTDGYRTWGEDDIAQFEAKHEVGSRARLALALLLYTGQRRSDVVKMGRQHIRNGVLKLKQQKTGTALTIPIHAALQAIIDATPTDHLTYLTTRSGSPFSAAGFTNWFRDVCNEAGLPKGTSAHGLRKAACRRLAEAGCSVSVIAAISGHKSLNEVQRYTAAADQLRMARSGIEAVQEAFPEIGNRTSNYKPT